MPCWVCSVWSDPLDGSPARQGGGHVDQPLIGTAPPGQGEAATVQLEGTVDQNVDPRQQRGQVGVALAVAGLRHLGDERVGRDPVGAFGKDGNPRNPLHP